jgi:hypothetical protein
MEALRDSKPLSRFIVLIPSRGLADYRKLQSSNFFTTAHPTLSDYFLVTGNDRYNYRTPKTTNVQREGTPGTPLSRRRNVNIREPS